MVLKALILAGGHGTRLRPITHTTQKQLIPIANKPLIHYVIEDLVNVGIKEIGIIYGPNFDQFQTLVGNGDIWNVKITYIHQPEPKGLAHCIMVAKEFLGDDRFIMYLGDNLLKGGIEEFVKNFTTDASIMLCPVPDPQKFGVAELNENGSIKKLVEKPKDPKTNLAVIGIYGFSASIHEACQHISPSWRNELEIVDAIQWLIDNGKTVTSANVKGWWKDTGSPNDLLEGNQLVLEDLKSRIRGKIDQSSKVQGNVEIGEGTTISNSTVIRGPVSIGKDCKITRSYIGPYTSIGDGVTLEDAEIEFSMVFDEANIAAKTPLVNSLIGKKCKITSQSHHKPQGTTLVLAEQSEVEL